LTDEKTSVPTYSPAKPEITATKTSITTKTPAVLLVGRNPVIHGCLFKKSSSSDRSATSSNTMERYKSELTITTQASIRQLVKTDVIPVAETKKMTQTMRLSLLVSLFIKA
jgi:hypothetical protein